MGRWVPVSALKVSPRANLQAERSRCDRGDGTEHEGSHGPRYLDYVCYDFLLGVCPLRPTSGKLARPKAPGPKGQAPAGDRWTFLIASVTSTDQPGTDRSWALYHPIEAVSRRLLYLVEISLRSRCAPD